VRPKRIETSETEVRVSDTVFRLPRSFKVGVPCRLRDQVKNGGEKVPGVRERIAVFLGFLLGIGSELKRLAHRIGLAAVFGELRRRLGLAVPHSRCIEFRSLPAGLDEGVKDAVVSRGEIRTPLRI
jgi:hypothetical protein